MPSEDIHLNCINRSDFPPPQFAIYQTVSRSPSPEMAVAWMVIDNLGLGQSRAFEFPLALAVGASDPGGNFTPVLEAFPGQAFQMVATDEGDLLQPYEPGASAPDEIDVRNALSAGEINAQIYRNGKLLAQKNHITPGQNAIFRVDPAILISVISGTQEGEIFDPSKISAPTEISLLGIKSADIVITCGGSGGSATPYQFTLQNVVPE